MRTSVSRWGALSLSLLVLLAAWGCTSPQKIGSIVYFCDGAGWYSGGPRVRAGLKDAGFQGAFETFGWSTLLGAGTDHLIAARSKAVAMRLTHRIEAFRKANPTSKIYVMGLSAGTAVALSAIEQLPRNVKIDNVALLSSSASASRDLTPVLRRVGGILYNTTSRSDAILESLSVNADGGDGPPAGQIGFRKPRKRRSDTNSQYRRVVNLPWKPAYLAYDWNGGHVAATSPRFIQSVIAPRLLTDGAFPLDRQIVSVAPGAGE